jgi:hypothetical protein
MGKKLNILDTPGYLDFISEALAAVRVADFALVVVHAQHGIGGKRSGVVSKYLTFSTSRLFLSRRFGTGRPCFEQDFETWKNISSGTRFHSAHRKAR